MPQLGVRALNAALVALCSFQVAGLFNRFAEEGLRAAPAYGTAATPAAPDGVSAWNDRKIILDRNLFGAQILAQPSLPESTEPVEETKLPLVLEATISASGESYSRAAIRDSGAPASMVLGVGDPVTGHSGVSVALIERGRVVLLNAGRREELLLDEGSPGASVSRAGSSRRRARKPAATPRRPRTPRPPSRRERAAPAPQPPSDSPELSELSRRLQSGELTRDELSESIRRQIESGELSSDRFGDLLAELAEEEQRAIDQRLEEAGLTE
jgi:type II secretory pathway component PulC